ncbi:MULTISPECIES: hypothetical protein [unclassified Caballeronia]|uniref:hypothetical protein n=1 Tax=unclassified Caballeronia TaxID=2646786 RepID=UPI002860EA7F|nr:MULTISPECIES: hypothetical protein [unclassified Caballeronia]MDR5776973.1 hypothetical protein [Caballeronia sp. LZ002]MDR5852452.1 hypothetical protein [Caballeronia sp. LZ003]
MASQKKFERSEIEIARQRLLEAIYSELPDDRFRKRDAVKQLLSTLIAARERGLAFEKIAEILKASGLDLPTETLRSYFFELKTQSELAAEGLRHAQKIALTRDSIQRQVREKHTEHGNTVATRRARLTQATPPLEDAFKDDPLQPEPFEPVAVPRRVTTAMSATILHRENARPASPAAPVPPQAAELARIESERVVPETAVGVKAASGLPTSEKAHRAAPGGHSESAVTLSDVEQASLATEERTELLGDLELREGDFVFYVSGQPFHGFLTKGQIRLLRTVGRVIAPTKGKSSKDFVTMPAKL